MMTTKNYTDFTTHKAAHEAFVTKLTGVTTPVSTETIGYAKEW
jgi:hemerythrin